MDRSAAARNARLHAEEHAAHQARLGRLSDETDAADDFIAKALSAAQAPRPPDDPEPPVPTQEQPHYHLSAGGAGYLFWAPDANAWLLEHCVDGYWGACRVGVGTDETWRANRAAMHHLTRAAQTTHHRTRYPARLAGTHHAPWKGTP